MVGVTAWGFVPCSPVHRAELTPRVGQELTGDTSAPVCADGGAILVQQNVATDVTRRQLK